MTERPPRYEGRFEHEELPGGLRLHLSPSNKFKTAVVKLFVQTDLTTGTATEVAALPFVLRRGTAGIPSLRGIARRLESLFGAALDPDVLKLGERHVLSMSLTTVGERFLPQNSTNGGVLEQGVQVLADLLLRPALDAEGALRAEEVAQEKEKLRRLIQGLINHKGAYAAQRCVEAMCADEPYGVFEYGKLEDLEGIDGAALEARRRKVVAEGPFDLYVAGAVDMDHVRGVLERAFAIEGRTETTLRGTTPHPPPSDEVRVIREAVGGLSQSKLVLGLRTPTRLGDPEYWDLLLMHGVLGGFPHSKLFRNVREKAGLCYDASSSLERFKGLLFMFAGIDAEQFDRTRDMCLEQLEAIRQGDISDEELTNSRLAFRQAYQSLLDSPARLINVEFLMRLAGLSGAPSDAMDALEKVTREGVQQAAQRVKLDTVYLLEPDS